MTGRFPSGSKQRYMRPLSERMQGNEGDQQEKYCYHGDEDASQDPRSVETRPHAKRILLVSPIDEVIRGGRLRWFGHVQRRDADNVTLRVMNLTIPYQVPYDEDAN